MTWRPEALALPLAATLALGACGGGTIADPPRASLVPVPAAQARPDGAGGRVLSAPGARPSASRRPVVHPRRHPPDRRLGLTVQVTRAVRVRSRPGGAVVARLAPKTSFGSSTIVPVVARRGSWLGVITSALPNGRVGWISVGAGLVGYRDAWHVEASLSRRRVVVRDAGRVVLSFPVAVGGPSTPTPVGRFAVTDKLFTNDPGSPYGCCILALSAHQPSTPQGWGGGNRIAIHATDLPETIGSAASLGCLRAPAADARRIVRVVPLGTLVTIRA